MRLKVLRPVIGILAAAAAFPTPGSAHDDSSGMRTCAGISLAPNTDWYIAVHAKGTSCRWARRLAWDRHWFFWDRCDRCDPAHESSDWAPRDGRVLRKYTCRSRADNDGQSHADIRCVPEGSPWRSKRKVVVMESY